MAKHLAIWDVVHKNKGGKVLNEFTKSNFLTNLGEKLVLLCLFRAEQVPDFFSLGLFYGTLTEESTLIQVPNEPFGNGYSRQQLLRQASDFPSILLDEDGDYILYSKTLTITASGGTIGPVNGAFLVVTDTDDVETMIAVMSMPTTMTIQDAETLTFTIKIKAM